MASIANVFLLNAKEEPLEGREVVERESFHGSFCGEKIPLELLGLK